MVSQQANPIMHFRMAEYSDNGHELWHSQAWGASITLLLGAYALARNGQILFSSNFVQLPFTYIEELGITIQYS